MKSRECSKATSNNTKTQSHSKTKHSAKTFNEKTAVTTWAIARHPLCLAVPKLPKDLPIVNPNLTPITIRNSLTLVKDKIVIVMIILNRINQTTIIIRKSRKGVNRPISRIIHLAELRVK